MSVATPFRVERQWPAVGRALSVADVFPIEKGMRALSIRQPYAELILAPLDSRHHYSTACRVICRQFRQSLFRGFKITALPLFLIPYRIASAYLSVTPKPLS